jgi:hypothetical protein
MSCLELEGITGPNLTLRLIRTDNAWYVHGLRYNTCIYHWGKRLNGRSEEVLQSNVFRSGE